VFNDPRAIRDHSEKLAIAKYTRFTVPTLVTRLARPTPASSSTRTAMSCSSPWTAWAASPVFRVASGDSQPQRDRRNAGSRRRKNRSWHSATSRKSREGDKRILFDRGESRTALPCAHPQAWRERAATSPPGAPASQSPSRGETWKSRTRSAGARAPGAAPRRPGCDRGLAHRDQRHQRLPASGKSPTRTGFDVAGMFLDAVEAAVS